MFVLDVTTLVTLSSLFSDLSNDIVLNVDFDNAELRRQQLQERNGHSASGVIKKLLGNNEPILITPSTAVTFERIISTIGGIKEQEMLLDCVIHTNTTNQPIKGINKATTDNMVEIIVCAKECNAIVVTGNASLAKLCKDNGVDVFVHDVRSLVEQRICRLLDQK